MIKVVTTQEIKQTTVIYLDDWKQREYLEKRLARFTRFKKKDGLFGIGGDYGIGSIDSVPVVWVYCEDNNEKHDELVAIIQKIIADNIRVSFSAETKIGYVG